MMQEGFHELVRRDGKASLGGVVAQPYIRQKNNQSRAPAFEVLAAVTHQGHNTAASVHDTLTIPWKVGARGIKQPLGVVLLKR